MILSASFEASSMTLILETAGATAFLATDFLAADGALDLETPDFLLGPRGARGLEEIISSKDLSRLADILNITLNEWFSRLSVLCVGMIAKVAVSSRCKNGKKKRVKGRKK